MPVLAFPQLSIRPETLRGTLEVICGKTSRSPLLDINVSEWTNLFLRWFHVVAGILWIGQTAFFSWLDTRMTLEADPETGEQVWMVHSGGFYRVQKLKTPASSPKVLHWFKWEALFSWLSGMLLLGLVYHAGGLMVEYGTEMSAGRAASVGTLTLILGWVVYDLLWNSPLGRHEKITGILSFALLMATAYGLTRVMSGRAAYIHVGALLGTIMTCNVWMRILPSQRRMVKAVQSGQTPDLTLSARAKNRSRHNTFMAVPLIFIMISSHFPTASYGRGDNWIMLGGFLLLGFAARWLMNRWNERG